MQNVQHKRTITNFISDSLYNRDATNFWLQKINPLWSTYQILGKITEKKHLANEMIGIVVRCNHRMQYGVSGQHHPVIVEIEGRRYERTYSLTQLDVHNYKLNDR